MSNRFLMAVSALAVVPTLAMAQQPARPPAQPPAQQPAARPAARPAAGPHREGGWEFRVGGAMFGVSDEMNAYRESRQLSDPNPGSYLYGGEFGIYKHFGTHFAAGVNAGLGTGDGGGIVNGNVDLMWTTNLNKNFHFFIPVGFDITRITDGSPTSEVQITSTWGVNGGLGVRAFMSEKVALRVEGRVTYDNFDEIADAQMGYSGRIGLSFFMGGGPPKDTDADGVPDKKDRCANTPAGARVDVNGCPTDADRDGVFDGLDRCASTPANTPVTPDGCPRDTDRDGVSDNLDRCANTPAGTPVDANGCPRDADSDGVSDNLDRCANTPAGTPVDANGCPRDSDADRVTDNLDRCPNTPAGTPVDANGCPRDTDADGVADNADRCPNTAAGTQVGPDGCPIARDADRDGVVDERDRCANTPAGRQVDANGCPMAELPQVGQALVLRNINFAAGTARLTPTSQTAIREMAASMAAAITANSSARFEVGGYTDNRGSAATNTRLSLARANAVRTALTQAGVPAANVTAQGYGPNNPVAPNTTAAGRAQNRRVEIKRLQ